MQGDYMRLNYALARQLAGRQEAAGPTPWSFAWMNIRWCTGWKGGKPEALARGAPAQGAPARRPVVYRA